MLATNNNNSNNNNLLEKPSLADISVGEILDLYKSDTDLLKHILAAKAEEDKRRTALELRKAEEAKLQSKFLDLHLGSDSALLEDTGLDLASFSSHNWLSPPPPQATSDLLTPNSLNNNTPPSPTTSLLQPLSPYTLFDVPFSELKLSAPSSPETNPPVQAQFEDIEDNDNTSDNNNNNNTTIVTINSNNNSTTTTTTSTSKTTAATESQQDANDKDASQQQLTVQVTTAPSQTQQIRERTSCKRTLSRARSHRKPSVHRTSAAKKNRSQPQTEEKEAPLDHGKVMEALRAKVQRSTEKQKELLLNPKKEEFNSMSPSGILLLDLKNPKKTFPVRPKATPRASVVRKPSSFISAHRVKDASV